MSQYLQPGDVVQFTAMAIMQSGGSVPCGTGTVVNVVTNTGLVTVDFGTPSPMIYPAHYLEKVEPQGDRQ